VSISAIGAIGGVTPTIGALNAANQDGQTRADATGFGQLVAQGLGKVQQAQNNADDLAVSAATGDLTDVHDYMIASTEAQLATQLTVAVRNKAVDAFNEIMRMQA
jgi:flagellar hook-basal body complex protein FliE